MPALRCCVVSLVAATLTVGPSVGCGGTAARGGPEAPARKGSAPAAAPDSTPEERVTARVRSAHRLLPAAAMRHDTAALAGWFADTGHASGNAAVPRSVSLRLAQVLWRDSVRWYATQLTVRSDSAIDLGGFALWLGRSTSAPAVDPWQWYVYRFVWRPDAAGVWRIVDFQGGVAPP